MDGPDAYSVNGLVNQESIFPLTWCSSLLPLNLGKGYHSVGRGAYRRHLEGNPFVFQGRDEVGPNL